MPKVVHTRVSASLSPHQLFRLLLDGSAPSHQFWRERIVPRLSAKFGFPTASPGGLRDWSPPIWPVSVLLG